MSSAEEQSSKPVPWESLEAKVKQLEAIVDASLAAPHESETPAPESSKEEISLAQWQAANAQQWERWQQIIADFDQKEKKRKLQEQAEMTQSNDRLDRLEALMASQLEYNRQVAEQATADRQATNERMTRLERQAETANNRLTRIEQQTEQNAIAIAALEQNAQAVSRDLAVLVDQQAQSLQRLDRLENVTRQLIDVVQRVNADQLQANAELRAGQERQGRILDYLLQKEQERQDGEQQS